MAKDKPSKERKPDLSGEDYAELEEKVTRMMEPERKKIAVSFDDVEKSTEDQPSAPEITDKPAKKSIKITHGDEDSPEEISKVIEETNKEIAAEDGGLVGDVEIIPDDSEAEPGDIIEPDLAEEPVLEDESVETETEAEDEEPEEDLEVVPEIETEPEVEPEPEPVAPEPAPFPKQKPLTNIRPKPVMDVRPPDPSMADEPATEKAVDEIVQKESDRLIEVDDEEISKGFDDIKPSSGSKFKDFFSGWWHNPFARWATVLLLLGGIVAAGVMPITRYYALNLFGVRSAASLTVFDESTQQPLKNVQIKIAGQNGLTDADGKVRLENIKLGPTEMSIEKRAFAPIVKQITIGWGSNPLGDYKVTPVGAQYSFVFTDYVSDKPLSKVQVTSGDASAQSDGEGKAKLTIDNTDVQRLDVTINYDGYREEKLTIGADTKTVNTVKLAPYRKHAFVSKRSGKYDVYSINVDGKNEKLLLEGTGSERDDMVLATHPSEDLLALVSTRDNKRNKDGFLLSTLTIIDPNDSTPKSVDQSERIQVVGWIGQRLLYVKVAAGTSAGSPTRHRLIAYNMDGGTQKELASSNYFNDVQVVGSKVYYSPSSAYAGGTAPSLYGSDADGSNKQTIVSKEVWNIFRTSYEQLTIGLQQEWYSYELSGGKLSLLKEAPANPINHVYTNSLDNKHSLWTEIRDGKGTLLSYDIAGKKDTVLKSTGGLKGPLTWLNNNTAVYRIVTNEETADYAINIDGGEPKKIHDVSNIGGVEDWFYY